MYGFRRNPFRTDGFKMIGCKRGRLRRGGFRGARARNLCPIN